MPKVHRINADTCGCEDIYALECGTQVDLRSIYLKPLTMDPVKLEEYPENDLEGDELDLFSFGGPSKINSLPKEVLLRIFEEVYQVSCRLEVDSPRLSDLAASRVFPDCLVNVCKAWRELVQSISRFSTRFHIFVDEPVSIIDLRRQFEMSKDLPIRIFVVRRDYSAEEDVNEGRRVAGVTKLLIRHIIRCEVVIFDLLQDSSLPRISDFSGKAEDLRLLKAKSRIAGSANEPFDPAPSTLRQISFRCPNLRIMDLDSGAFLNASSIPGWAESMKFLGQKELTIRKGGTIHLHHFLLCLSKLGHLFSLNLVELDLDPSSCLGRNLVSIFVQNFELEGLSAESVSGFFDNHINTIEVSSIALTRCGLATRHSLASWSLSLSDIDQEQDIVDFVRHWNGHSLGFNNCAGVDDTMLVLISDFQSSREGSDLNAHSLRELQIRTSGTIPISVKVLQELILVRKVVSKRHHALERSALGSSLGSSITLPMYSVYISGLGTKLDPAEMKWFCDNLDYFTWLADPVPSDSPILDWDISRLDPSELEHLDLDINTATSDASSSSQPPESYLSQRSSASHDSHHTPDSPVINDDFAFVQWTSEDLLKIP